MSQQTLWRPKPTYAGQYTAPALRTLVHPQESDSPVSAPCLPADLSSDHSIPEELDADASGVGPAFRHSGWSNTRERVVAALVSAAVPSGRLAAFKRCGHRAYVLQSLTNPERFKIASSKCKDRFCKPCARERARGVARKLLEHVDKRELRFLTLTLKTQSPDLKTELDRLYSSFQLLRRRAFWKRHVTGGAAMLEVKWNEKSSRWHPHLHVLVEGRYIPHTHLVKEWQAVTGDSFIVDIRAVKDNAKVTQYICKYATDPIDRSIGRDHDRLVQAIHAFKGRKTCLTFGTWRGVDLTDPDDDDGWRHLMTLDQLITQVAQGDKQARTILQSIWVFEEQTQKNARAAPCRSPDRPPLSALTRWNPALPIEPCVASAQNGAA